MNYSNLRILTKRLMLRPLNMNDEAALFGHNSNPAVAKFMLSDVKNREESKAILLRRIEEVRLHEDDDVLSLGVCAQTDENELVGDVKLFLKNADSRQGSLGCVINPKFHRTGYATEVAKALMDFGFFTVGLHRIYAECDARNVGSYTAMEKIGMRREAHLKQCRRLKGEWADEYTYALLKSEWSRMSKDRVPAVVSF